MSVLVISRAPLRLSLRVLILPFWLLHWCFVVSRALQRLSSPVLILTFLAALLMWIEIVTKDVLDCAQFPSMPAL
jgi:hypothetical protein